MAQEEKNLLLKDLSARLPYGVICSTPEGDGHLCSINQTIFGNEYGINIKATKRSYFSDRECEIRPYLRSMSSMTDKEYVEYSKLWNLQDEFPTDADIRLKVDVFDWLNKHHFDYRGLIEKGLAIGATKENNPYKE
jgi:hypothetical protein